MACLGLNASFYNVILNKGHRDLLVDAEVFNLSYQSATMGVL